MDFTALATALTTEVTSALTAVQPVIILVLSAVVGYALFRRFVGSK